MAGPSGLDAGTAALVIAAINGGTTFRGLPPFKTRFMTTIRTANNGADTEWGAGGGYAAGGVTGPAAWAAAATAVDGATQNTDGTTGAITVTNAPSAVWQGCTIWDATPRALWYAPVSPQKTVNPGDTVTVPAGSFQTKLG